jgi:DNA-directed RNA polymerase subunit H (RpoH/RPB5)
LYRKEKIRIKIEKDIWKENGICEMKFTSRKFPIPNEGAKNILKKLKKVETVTPKEKRNNNMVHFFFDKRGDIKTPRDSNTQFSSLFSS